MEPDTPVAQPARHLAVVFDHPDQHGEWESASHRLAQCAPAFHARLFAELPLDPAPSAWHLFREFEGFLLGPRVPALNLPPSGAPGGEGAILWMIPHRAGPPLWIVSPPSGGAATEVVLPRPVFSVRLRLPPERRSSPLLLQTILPSDFAGAFAQAWERRTDPTGGLLWLVPSRMPGAPWSRHWLTAARNALNSSPCRGMPLRELSPDAALVSLLRDEPRPSVIVASPIVAPLLAEAAAMHADALGVAPSGYIGGRWPVARVPIAAKSDAAPHAWPAGAALLLGLLGERERARGMLPA